MRSVHQNMLAKKGSVAVPIDTLLKCQMLGSTPLLITEWKAKHKEFVRTRYVPSDHG